MWSPVTLNDGTTHAYGFGWFLDTFQGHRRVHHQLRPRFCRGIEGSWTTN